MNTTTKEKIMNTNEAPEALPMAQFGVDNDPARVQRLETTILRLRTEVAAVRRAAQHQRARADRAEAELEASTEEAGRQLAALRREVEEAAR